jgi:hypothetical protein
MSKEIDFNAEPASTVKSLTREIDPNIEVVDGIFDGDFYTFKLQSSNGISTTERLSKELLSDLFGKDNAHLYSKLKEKLRNAIGRIK